MLAQFRQVSVDERPRCGGEDDLTAVTRRRDPRGAVQFAPGIALARQRELASVQTHPHPDRPWCECVLPQRRRRKRLPRMSKRVQKRIPLGVHLNTAVRGD